MKKLFFTAAAAILCFAADAQVKLTKRYKGSVGIGSKVYQCGTIEVEFPDTASVKITPTGSDRYFSGAYSSFLNPDTNSPFGSQAAIRLFIQDNFFNDPRTTVDTAASYAVNVENFAGNGNSYNLSYVPVSGTITATVNGVQELVDYSGTGQTVTLTPAYTIDSTDVVIFTYSYQD